MIENINTSSNFVKEFNIPQGKMHFKPESIEDIGDDNIVTLRGREGITNSYINVRITRDMFSKLVVDYPREMSGMVGDYIKKQSKKKTEGENNKSR